MLEPYVWYDPHEIIKKLEWKIFQLKLIHAIEIENIIGDLVATSNSLKTYQNHKIWNFEPFSGE